MKRTTSQLLAVALLLFLAPWMSLQAAPAETPDAGAVEAVERIDAADANPETAALPAVSGLLQEPRQMACFEDCAAQFFECKRSCDGYAPCVILICSPEYDACYDQACG